MTLYEIKKEIEGLIDFETGEITDLEAFEQLQVDKKEKIRNVLFVIKNKKAEAEALAEEIKRLQERKKSCETADKNLRDYLMANIDGKFKDEYFTVSVKEIDDFSFQEDSIPDEYFTVETVKKLDKAILKKLVKEGTEIPGVVYGKKPSLTIR